jgi:hypothetical protein
MASSAEALQGKIIRGNTAISTSLKLIHNYLTRHALNEHSTSTRNNGQAIAPTPYNRDREQIK